MNKKNIFLIKFLTVILNIVYTVIKVDEGRIPLFIILILLCLLNMQIRIIYFNEKTFILSILIDVILIYILFNNYRGFTYLFLYITLIDGISFSKKYTVAIITITGVVLLYLLQCYSIEFTFINVFIYVTIIVSLLYINKINYKNSQLEYLYDDVRRYSYELEKTKKQLELYSTKVRDLAQLQERNRISEEIHDTIGHRLTALLIQMQAGVSILDLDRDKSKQLLKDSVENLRESIDILRNTVKSIKQNKYKNIVDSIEKLINKFTMETGINVEFKVNGNVYKITTEIESVLYKNVQEALTNAAKHGGGKNIYIELNFNPEVLCLRVNDDGIGCTNVKKGMGISNMEERLRLVGGNLKIYNINGFVVESIIPI